MLNLFFSTLAFAAMPLWISEGSFQKSGNTLILVCSGKGDTIAKARSEAMNSCVENAGEQLSTTWKLKSKSEETDMEVKLKKEVLADQRVTGLACDVQKEYVDTRIETPTVYVKCRFDLAKAKSTAINMEKITAANGVSVDVRPGCEYIVIHGGPYGRHVACEDGKPTTFTVDALVETYVTIHPKKGYIPQNVKLNHDVTYQEFVVNLEKRDLAKEEWERSGDREKDMKPLRPQDFETFDTATAIPR